tara:strand:- start:32544 stop:33092 length:549 start_codon:yes stop_codon:yes gene_type:complete
MINLLKKLKSSPTAYFFSKVGLICILLQLFYDFFLFPNGKVDWFLCRSGAFSGAFLLNIFGWEVNCWGSILAVNGYGAVEIINDCNGLILMGLYSSFILAYPAKLKLKTGFTVIGIILIYVSNIFRIMGFALVNVYIPNYWDIFHEFSAFIFLYPVILILWYYLTKISEKGDIFSSSKFSRV